MMGNVSTPPVKGKSKSTSTESFDKSRELNDLISITDPRERIFERLLEKIGADEDRLEFADRRQKRWFDLVYVSLFVGLLIFLTLYLTPNQPDLYEQILLALTVFAGGFGTGYGYKTTRA